MQHANPTPDPDHGFSPSLLPAPIDASAQDYLNRGKSLYQSYLAHARQTDLDAAIQHFQRAVEIEPTMAEAYIQLASALWEQGTINLELAQFYCETALRLNPRQSEAHLFLGYFLQRSGFLEDSAQQFSRAIAKRFWRSSRPRIALANVLLKQSLQADRKGQQIALAARGVCQFVTGCLLLPWDPATCGVLQEALVYDFKVTLLTQLAKGFQHLKLPGMARRVYHLGIRTLPQEPLFYHLLGDIHLFDHNQPQEALVYYQHAQDRDPGNLNLLKKLGKAYAMIEDAPHAIHALEQVIAVAGEDYDSLYQLAQVYTNEKAYIKALYYFKEAERQRPLNPYLHSNMAYVMFKLDDIDGAFEKYKTAMEYGTEPLWLSTVSQTIGTICYQVYQDAAQAIHYFQLAVDYHPENIEALAALGDLYFETNQLESALGAYKTVLQLDPKNADCYSNVGYILWQLDINQGAIDAYQAALHFDPDNAIAHNNLGVIYLDEEANTSKALPLFQRALSLKPDYTLACFNIGRALEAQGNPMDAADAYGAALKLNQINAELQDIEIQERLDRLFDARS